MRLCIVDDNLCVNVDQIVSVYACDGEICITTTRTGDYPPIACFGPFDPDDEDDVAFQSRLYDEILEALMDQTIQIIDPDAILSRLLDEDCKRAEE
jgi:hypothetical protein